uniref:Uncharacterized protein n=1 Tax=Chenopodium quinoa TaxID=63459 RepID=A0A803MFH8_CHEQI
MTTSKVLHMKKLLLPCSSKTSIDSVYASPKIFIRTISSNERSKEQHPSREETIKPDPRPGLSPGGPDLVSSPHDSPPSDRDDGTPHFGWDPTLSPPKGPLDRTQPDRPPPSYHSSS